MGKNTIDESLIERLTKTPEDRRLLREEMAVMDVTEFLCEARETGAIAEESFPIVFRALALLDAYDDIVVLLREVSSQIDSGEENQNKAHEVLARLGLTGVV